ncbi:UNVERIFIED_CONTAM: hypothetical protein K2H54_056076 [Gekko kuhli]
MPVEYSLFVLEEEQTRSKFKLHKRTVSVTLKATAIAMEQKAVRVKRAFLVSLVHLAIWASLAQKAPQGHKDLRECQEYLVIQVLQVFQVNQEMLVYQDGQEYQDVMEPRVSGDSQGFQGHKDLQDYQDVLQMDMMRVAELKAILDFQEYLALWVSQDLKDYQVKLEVRAFQDFK